MTVSLGGYVQAALEQTPNAEGGAGAVSSNLFYLPCSDFQYDPKPGLLEYKDELRGVFANSAHGGAATYNPSGSFNVRLYPGTLGFILHMLCGTVVTTAGNGVITDPDSATIPATAYRHVFTFKADDPPQSAQFLYSAPAGPVTPAVFGKAQGVGMDECTFAVKDGAWEAAAKLIGLYHSYPVDPTLTPSYETPRPWGEGQMALTWLGGSATTKEFSWGAKNGIVAERQFTTSSLYPDSLAYEQNLPLVSGSIAKRAFDADDWAALVGGTPFAAKIKMVHSSVIGATVRKHTLWVELPACQYVGGGRDAIKNERRNEATFDWEARYDTATAKECTITLVNATAAYATY